ncbi:MAG: hypothetical protein IKK85_05785 [Clostridia bacterium]|nr:hypothetical protein [Clostridia bacterium]
MDFIGKWKFHSIGVSNDNGELVYLTAEGYLDSPMLYIDETDKDAVNEEMKERKKIIGMQIKICDDGKMYMLMPLPEGVSQAEVDKAVAAGFFTLVDGMIADSPMQWELRDGELWYDTGIKGEVFGEEAQTWVKALNESGYFTFINYRFIKE